MMTLDTLARMAARMPSELGDDRETPYRFPDHALHRRQVALPSVREESRRGLGLFAFVVGVAGLTIGLGGLASGVASALVTEQAFDLGRAMSDAALYAVFTALVIAPFAAVGILRELRRYRDVRDRLGSVAWLDTRGYLSTEDGRVRISAADRG